MIVKIDHIALATSDLDDDALWLQSLGYKLKFRETNLRDLENKRPFMDEFGGQLEMALLERGGSLAIELLDHGHITNRSGRFFPVMEGAVDCGQPAGDPWKIGGVAIERCSRNAVDFFVVPKTHDPEFLCNKVIVESRDIEASIRFWTELGFKSRESEDQPVGLEFRSLFGGPACSIYLRDIGGGGPFRLDSRGFNCLAFFSTDAASERTRFAKVGLDPTPFDEFRVNNRTFSIFWVRGANGEVAEVIGLKRSL